MKSLLNIKGMTIGEGKPFVCISVMKPTKEEITEETARLVNAGVRMIEWRIDAFENPTDPNALMEVLEALKPITAQTILVYTFRSKAQGGLIQLPEEEIRKIHQTGVNSGCVDLIDIEYFALSDPNLEIENIQKMGVHVIASHHDFNRTPASDVMMEQLEKMRESGADIVKLAVMPRDRWDVMELIRLTLQFHETYPDCPVITMSMGSMGSVSRVMGEFTGSCVTFGAAQKSSAPGQWPMGELEQVLDMLHERMGGFS